VSLYRYRAPREYPQEPLLESEDYPPEPPRDDCFWALIIMAIAALIIYNIGH